jgi:hypothetical protein
LISTDNITEFIFDPSIPFGSRLGKILDYQLQHVSPFRLFAGLTEKEITGRQIDADFSDWSALPYLPIELFRSHRIISGEFEAEMEFHSSGTTGTTTSRHLIAAPSVYHKSLLMGFEDQYGPASDWSIFALLPSYLEQEHSSLVHMTGELMRAGDQSAGGFYKYNYEAMMTGLKQPNNRKKLLIGVSFALWEFAERYQGADLSDVIIMETGGMKGRRREIVRDELHEILQSAFHTDTIHSEYGMTELLSQAYSSGKGIFRCPHWMKVLVRDPYDPFRISPSGKGVLNIIDLANVYSCSCLATNDVGVVYPDGSFEVKGRLDGSALRGCNLLF